MISFVVETETKRGRTYRSFQGVSEDDFAEGTPESHMKLFAVQYCTEEAQQDAHRMM